MAGKSSSKIIEWWISCKPCFIPKRYKTPSFTTEGIAVGAEHPSGAGAEACTRVSHRWLDCVIGNWWKHVMKYGKNYQDMGRYGEKWEGMEKNIVSISRVEKSEEHWAGLKWAIGLSDSVTEMTILTVAYSVDLPNQCLLRIYLHFNEWCTGVCL